METTTTATCRRTAWNKSKLIGQKSPLKLKEIWAIRIRLQLECRTRELALFNLFFSSRRRHTSWPRDWSSDVCSSDLVLRGGFVTVTVTVRKSSGDGLE